MPAAWVEAWRERPSRRLEMSSSFSTWGLPTLMAMSSGSFSRAMSSVMPSSSGTSLAMRSVSAKLMPSARPTSRMAALAFMVPKVVIWATRSTPYFSAT